MIQLDVKRKMLTSDGVRELKVSITIPPHSLTCIYGPSGAGKTTLLRMIAGLMNPDEGIIRIGDNVLYDSKKHINLSPQRRHIAFMFQDYALFPNMTVEQNIIFAQNKQKDYDLINRLIETFGLETLKRQKPQNLSGGQKQRVALARALASKPQVLLLDEPLSAVDEEMKQNLQNEIMKAHELFGATTLMVSHDKTEIKKIATHILNIDKMPVDALQSPTFL